MKTWIMVIVLATLLIAGTFSVMALSKQSANIIPCSSCGNKCTAESNCGSPTCAAANGTGSCNCAGAGSNGSCVTESCGGNCNIQSCGCGCKK